MGCGKQDALTLLYRSREASQAGVQCLEALIAADDGVTSTLDVLVAMVTARRAERFDTPRRACVLPPWDFEQEHGLSESESSPLVWTKRLDEWREGRFREGKSVFIKRTRLFLVCAETNRLVPSGHKGQGYRIELARTWFRRSVSLTAFALQLAAATLGAIVVSQLPGNVVGALAEEATTASAEAAASTIESRLGSATAGDTCAEWGRIQVGCLLNSFI